MGEGNKTRVVFWISPSLSWEKWRRSHRMHSFKGRMGSYCSCQRSDISKQFFRDATAQVFWVVREMLCLAQWYGLWVDLCSVDLLRPQKLHCVLSIAWNRKTMPWKLESVESRRGQGIWGAEGMLFKPRQRPSSSSEQQHAAMIREPGVHPWRREDPKA